MSGPQLTPEATLLIIVLLLPALVGVTAYFTRPRARRLLGALAGGVAYAGSHIAWDTLASFTGWWQFPAGRHAPLYYYVGSLAWGACTALIGWRVQRRFGLLGLGLYLAGLGVLGTVNDYAGMAALDTSHLITFAPGIAPVLADTACSASNAIFAQIGMRLVAGKATADRLAVRGASWRAL